MTEMEARRHYAATTGAAQTVRLPMCASDTGMPRVVQPPINGFLADHPFPENELLARCLRMIRQKGLDHHGVDLLPDAEDPHPRHWRLLKVEDDLQLGPIYDMVPA